MLEQFKSWFLENKKVVYDDLFTFLSFPSISTDPAYKGQVNACAVWLKQHLEAINFKTELWQTPGHPTLYGEQMKAGQGRPTLLFYLHYDVQPADPLDQWKSPPFKPVIRGGKVFARGAIDNKGQCFYTLTALRAFHALSKKLDVNVKLCIEGEEEVGSSGLNAILQEKKSQLKSDYLLVVDLDMLGENTPSVTLGIRGMAALNLVCQNSTVDLHSGKFGGIVMNPAKALAHALSALWDEEGRVAVPHFYDKVKTFDKGALKLFDWEVEPKEWTRSFSVGSFEKEKGYSLLESNWIRPSVEINGLLSGYTDSGVKTIIPSKAMAKLSCRLVPDQDHKEVIMLISDFLKEKIPKGMDLKLESFHGSDGWIASQDASFSQIVSQAFEDVFQKPCKRVLCGATIPIAPALAKTSGAQLVLTGVALPEDNMHAPNESFALDRFEKGFLSIVRILETLGDFGEILARA